MRKIVKDKEILQQRCKDVSEKELDVIHGLLLKELMFRHNAVGIAASQIGILKNAFAMKYRKGNKIINSVFINPKILGTWGPVLYHSEKCLSLKKEFKVKRRDYIEVTDEHLLKGKVLVLSGRNSQIFQHEYDHLYGITVKERNKLDEPIER